jgi:hypothetical protein
MHDVNSTWQGHPPIIGLVAPPANLQLNNHDRISGSHRKTALAKNEGIDDCRQQTVVDVERQCPQAGSPMPGGYRSQ